MANRLAVLTAAAAAMMAIAVPAYAQEGAPSQAAQGAGEAQYQIEQPSTGAASVTGEVVERGGYFYVVDGATSKEYVLNGAEGLFAPFEGEVATVYGTADCTVAICSLEVEGVRGLEEEATIVGEVVEIGGWQHLVDDATGTEYYLVGSFDSVEEAEGLAGERVEATGVTQCFTDGPAYGCTLAFSSIELVEETGSSEQEIVPAGGQGVDQATDAAEVAASEQDTLPATGSGEGIVSSAAKILPSTGGILPIAGLAGLLILAGGLVTRGILNR
ncbi:hypothetical protein GBA65_20620 [Rubrobacter marinus]|uniref:Gram-positive cocci surface proteins LPxTG domain-containing protein n=1 Tax=Rubrobacter marinus TaxID=2653852 RepID=A0A6G8Q233_9ACTN|nr:hypothetical protein [Rubrobacter marinus]QIN80519.1 hypothetical protein GBA65_20620 [Rubrobacter marinus]